MFTEKTSREVEEGRKRWEKEVEKAKRQKGGKEKRFSTVSDLEIKPIYTPEDIKDLDFSQDIGYPGIFPFTRGCQPTMYRGREWTFRMFSGMGSAEDTNKRWHHLLKEGEGEKAPKIKDLVVDVGAKSKDEAKGLASLGTCATFATQFRELGPTVSGKAFDDRIGCAVLVELLRGERFRFDLHAAFTVQEEVGLRGARVAAYTIEPDCAFALEGTIADDIPKDKDVSPTTELGKGPAITVMDHTFIADRRLVRLLTSTAKELGIPYQFKQPGVGGTDAGGIHLAREGVPSATVSVPCRYIHSPVALANVDDFNNTVRLMRESLSRLTRRTLN